MMRMFRLHLEYGRSELAGGQALSNAGADRRRELTAARTLEMESPSSCAVATHSAQAPSPCSKFLHALTTPGFIGPHMQLAERSEYKGNNLEDIEYITYKGYAHIQLPKRALVSGSITAVQSCKHHSQHIHGISCLLSKSPLPCRGYLAK